ncbi:hypothetical protein M422DRAFT_156470 [Sphaerobolus stellatus SS14]|nr:hypothetical protein M422DRAFT_156470 [Sphaerobolus stellatus SS14]
MERFACGGKLHITVNPLMPDTMRVRIEHHLPHTPYIKITLTEEMKDFINENSSLPVTTLYSRIVEKWPQNEVTQEQVYSYSLEHNKDVWRLNLDQVKSAIQVLKNTEGENIDMIPTHVEEGISIFAFALKDIVDSFGHDVTEIAMDSTWKTNAAAFELYAVVAEANGRSLPLAFAFISTGSSATTGAKDRALQDVLGWLKVKCPKIKFTLSDKDASEINACSAVFPDAKHQLCYWHAIRYLKGRLAEDKPPAAYDGRHAHKIHSFIDPTWVPGVTNSHVLDCEQDLTDETLPEPTPTPIYIPLARGYPHAKQTVQGGGGGPTLI